MKKLMIIIAAVLLTFVQAGAQEENLKVKRIFLGNLARQFKVDETVWQVFEKCAYEERTLDPETNEPTFWMVYHDHLTGLYWVDNGNINFGVYKVINKKEIEYWLYIYDDTKLLSEDCEDCMCLPEKPDGEDAFLWVLSIAEKRTRKEYYDPDIHDTYPRMKEIYKELTEKQ